MDFLPRPQGCPSSSIEIPCLTTDPYDGGDFRTFPSRTQWGVPRTVAAWSQLFKDPPPDFQAFWQTWLYFGSLEFIFNRRVSLHQFTRTSEISGRVVLDASALKDWFNEVPSMNDAPERVLLLAHASTLHVGLFRKTIVVESDSAHKLTLEEYATQTCFHDPRDPLTVASIGALLEVGREYLALAIPDPPLHPAIDGRGEREDGLIGSGNLLPQWSNPLTARLRRQGWCPSEIHTMQQRLNSAGLFFMGHVP